MQVIGVEIAVPVVDSRDKVEAWWRHYNESHPHTFLVD
jgi:hypothetical protein